MENPNPLATESFSYSWLVDRKPHDSSEKSSVKHQSFDFDVSFTPSHVSLVHADEIFSDGHIMPRSLKTSTSSVPPSPVSSCSLGNPSKRRYLSLGKWRKSSKRILQKCVGLVKPLYRTVGRSRKSNRVDDLARKVCEFGSWSDSVAVSPRRRSAVDWSEMKKMSSKDGFGYGLKRVKSWRCSAQASPRISPSRPSNAWCVDESSIHEAILYCKRSIEDPTIFE